VSVQRVLLQYLGVRMHSARLLLSH